MKKIFKIFAVILMIFIAPTICSADNNSVIVVQPGSPGFQKCAPNCKGIIRVNNFMGVRITFVDEAGHAVASSGSLSFDYITYNKNTKTKSVYYNGYGGDRNKLSMSGGGNFASSSVSVGNFKLFSEVVAAYNSFATASGYNIQARGIPDTGFTGGANWNFSKEANFFESLTRPGANDVPARVNSFIQAIASVSGGFNADDLLYKVAEGCGTGDNIYITMEPLFLWKDTGSNQYYFGSIADSYHFFGQVTSKINELTYKMYYDRPINDTFSGATPSSPSSEKIIIQSPSDLLSNAGFALGVDWANDPASYCGSCEYKSGIFTYDNKMYPGNLEIPSKFKSIQEFAFSKRDNGGAGCCELLKPQISTMPAEWQSAYKELCEINNGDPKCCHENPIKPGWMDGSVNNCCEDGGNSEAHEYDLDELFCDDGDLHVDHYFPKCDTDYYVVEDTDLNDKYCKMYCTERVTVEIPGSISAVSGRYFELTVTSKGTKSPYIEGFKRCRIRVQYDVWENDYRKVVEREIDNYKDFQMKIANYLVYNSAVQQPNVKGEITASQKCKKTTPKPCAYDPSKTCGYDEISKTVSRSTTYEYQLWKFNILEKEYYWPKLNPKKLDDYSEYELIYDDDKDKAEHKSYSTYQLLEQINKVESFANSLSCPSGYSKDGSPTRDKLPHEGAGYPDEYVPNVTADWKNKADAANTTFKNTAREAKNLEKDLDKCDYYFSKDGGKLDGPYKGANAEENYEFDASMSFSYTQVYMDNEQGLLLDEQFITFEETPGCVITGPTLGPDAADNLKDRRYSKGDYGKSGKNEKLVDFGEKDLDYEQNPTGYTKYRDEPYDADKAFTHDAKYKAECSWDEGENVYYTLTPNGAVSEGTDVINFTEHGQEYKLHLTTLDGIYETHWNISGLGTDARFDNFFLEKGTTCANEPASESSMFTCKIHVEYEIVLTGYCNGSNGTDTTVNVEDCDPYKEGYNLFSFKVVDPSNLFPNGYITSAGEVGHNWSDTEGPGQKILNEIQDRGKSDKTYSQEFLTYSFVLSPTDMGHIKNYNNEMNVDGGYSDFNMDCNCSDGVCKNCKSRFLNELANGNVNYDGTSHAVTGWSNKQTNLDGIRRKYGW